MVQTKCDARRSRHLSADSPSGASSASRDRYDTRLSISPQLIAQSDFQALKDMSGYLARIIATYYLLGAVVAKVTLMTTLLHSYTRQVHLCKRRCVRSSIVCS